MQIKMLNSVTLTVPVLLVVQVADEGAWFMSREEPGTKLLTRG